MDKELADFWPNKRCRLGVEGQCKNCRLSGQRRYELHIKNSAPNYPIEKFCPTCKETKPTEQFSLCPSKRDGLSSRCKECRRIHEKPKDKLALGKWKSWVQVRYGMTLDQAKALYDSQNGCCAICERSLENGRHEMDHDHATKKMRGILCPRCNRWLAALEFPGFLEAATAYLAKYR